MPFKECSFWTAKRVSSARLGSCCCFWRIWDVVLVGEFVPAQHLSPAARSYGSALTCLFAVPQTPSGAKTNENSEGKLSALAAGRQYFKFCRRKYLLFSLLLHRLQFRGEYLVIGEYDSSAHYKHKKERKKERDF